MNHRSIDRIADHRARRELERARAQERTLADLELRRWHRLADQLNTEEGSLD